MLPSPVPVLTTLARGAGAIALGALIALFLAFLYRAVFVPLRLARHYAAQGVRGSAFVPVVGDLPHLAAMRRALVPFAEWFRFWDDAGARSGRVSYFFLGPELRLRVADPELVKGVLRTPETARAFEKTALMKNTMGRLLGDGLLLSEGKVHAAHRGVIAPAFHFARLQGMLPLMADGATRAVTALLAAGEGGAVPVDFHQHAAGLTLWIVSFAAFGADLPGLLPAREGEGAAAASSTVVATASSSDAAAVYESISFLMTSFVSAVQSLTAFLPRDVQSAVPTFLYPVRARIDEEIVRLRHLVGGMLAAQRAVARGSGTPVAGAPAAPADGALAPADAAPASTLLVDFLLDSTLTAEESLDEALTFVLAGHETTSQTLAFAVLLLARAPAVRAALRAEVRGVLGGRAPTTDDLDAKRMPLLAGVLNEALRLYPPAPLVARAAIADVDIPRGGSAPPLRIARGTTVVIPIASIHRDATLWPEPDEFRPERWRDGLTALAHPLAFLPFSSGVRNCVGQHFATLESKVILAELVSRCDWDMDATYVHAPEMAVTLRPARGMPIRVRAAE